MITQASIPEVREDVIGFALGERKAILPQCQDLGPPDLITMVKYVPTPNSNATAGTTSGNGAGGANNGTAGAANGNNSLSTADPAALLAEIHSHDKLKGAIGTFFYTLGIDTSDPTSISISLKQIADAIAEKPQKWFGKFKNFSIARISLSTYNIFRRCDVNVIVHIPGAVQTYVLDSNGEHLPVSGNQTTPTVASTASANPIDQASEMDVIWAETFISGVIRSIMFMKDNADDGEAQPLVETLILNPLTAGKLDDVANTFIKLFPTVYERGVLTEAPCHVLLPTRTNNYLVDTLVELVRLTKSVDICRPMLEELIKSYPDASIVLARVLMACDYEIDAIDIINRELLPHGEEDDTISPIFRAELLCLQTQFLMNVKNDYKLALEVALSAVKFSPSEFIPWFLLTKIYIKLNDIENALLALNSCPMAQSHERYVLKRAVPIGSEDNLHLPLPENIGVDEILQLNPSDVNKEQLNSDPSLTRSAALNLKSTYLLAYRLLTEIVQITGWETLLKCRSKIFVMEDEYQISTDEVSLTNQSNRNEDTPSELNMRTKRLCDRWLDNLFMLLYEDLKIYTLWQTEQLYFEAQNSKYKKLTYEWEAFGLCAQRLGHLPEAASAFQRGLSQRFAPMSARMLLNYYIQEHHRVRNQSLSPNSELTSSQIISRINDLNSRIIDLCVKLCCWNHRWYIEFSIQLIDALSVAVQDMGIMKVINEIASRYPDAVVSIMKENFLDFLENYTNGFFDA